ALRGIGGGGGPNTAPLEGPSDNGYDTESYVGRRGEPVADDEFRQVTPGYFKTLGIPVDQGREFTAGDDARSPQVAIVNQAWVRRYFPGQDVIGKRLDLEGTEKDRHWRVVVGVTGDAHDLRFDKPTPPPSFPPPPPF